MTRPPKPDDSAPVNREVAFPGDAPAGSWHRAWPLALAGIGLILALIGTLPPQSWTWPEWRVPPVLSAIADWTFLTALTAATLFALAVAILVIWVGRRPIRGGVKKLLNGDLNWRDQLLLIVVTALAVAFIIGLFQVHGLGHGIPFQFWPKVDDPEVPATAEDTSAAMRDWNWSSETAEWLFGILSSTFGIVSLIVGSLLLIVAMMARARARQQAEATDEQDPMASAVAAAAEDSLDDLEAGGDPRAAIIKCYVRFERSLAAAETRRAPWQTPMEFMRAALAALPLDPGDVTELTRLFERARFSAHPVGATDQQAAWQALVAIRNALALRKPDAPAD